MYCPTCGNKLKAKANFCTKCGEEIGAKQQSSSKKKNKKKKPTEVTESGGVRIPVPALVGGAIVLIILAFVMLGNRPTQQMPVSSSQMQTGYSAQVQQVASNFMCPCGQCNDNLAVCNCNSPSGSVEVKGFIQQGLAQGKTVDQMIAAVQLKYSPESADSE